MYQRDYILRMIEMLSELIAGIFSFIKNGDFQKASQSLDRAYYDYLKQDAAFFQGISKEYLTENLLMEHNYTYGHLEILAGLFYAQAELFYARENLSRSLDLYEKSLMLYDFVGKESQTYSNEHQSKISLIQDRIKQLKRK